MEQLRKANGCFDATMSFYKELLADLKRRTEQIDECHRGLERKVAELQTAGFPRQAAEELAAFARLFRMKS